jgi:hypothetical protein
MPQMTLRESDRFFPSAKLARLWRVYPLLEDLPASGGSADGKSVYVCVCLWLKRH